MTAAVTVVLTYGAMPASADETAPTPPVQVLVDPTSQTVRAGDDVTLSAQAEDALHADVPVLRWDMEPAGGDWAPVPDSAGDATLEIDDIPASSDGSAYRAVFDDGLGGTLATNPAVLTVQFAPRFLTQPLGATVAPGGAFSLTVEVSAQPEASVAWQVATSSTGPWESAGATGTRLTGKATPSPRTTRWYRAVATNEVGVVASTAVAVTTGQLAPAAVRSLRAANPKSSTIQLTSTAPSGGGPVSGYSVTVKRGSTVVATKYVTATSLTLTEPVGTYSVVVRARGTGGDGPSTSVGVTVRAASRTLALSSATFYPFRDGYLDTVKLRAASTYAASGSIKLLDAKGRTVRAWALSSSTSWSVTFDGRRSSGATLAPGTYSVRLTLGGTTVTKMLKAAVTNAKASSLTWSVATIYPAKDGYRDTAVLSVRTTMPATTKVTIRKVGSSKVVASASLSRGTARTYTWNGRKAGKAVTPGKYRATVVVKGGDGPSHTTTRTIVVSAKKLVAKDATITVDAADAATFVISGDPRADDDGSVWFWSSPYLGSDIAAFAVKLGSTFNHKYSSIRLSGCLDDDVNDNSAAAVLFDRAGNISDIGFRVNDSGCSGVGVPASYVNNGQVRWFAGNASENYDYGVVDYWKITYKRYVLQ